MSAPPSATRPNLTAEPSACRIAPGLAPIKASVLISPCDRLTATIQGAPRGGRGRGWIGSARPPPPPPPPHPSRARPPPPPPPYQSECRRPDDAQDWRRVRHQREIDRKLVAAGDKFLGAVKRIDQKETATI